MGEPSLIGKKGFLTRSRLILGDSPMASSENLMEKSNRKAGDFEGVKGQTEGGQRPRPSRLSGRCWCY